MGDFKDSRKVFDQVRCQFGVCNEFEMRCAIDVLSVSAILYDFDFGLHPVDGNPCWPSGVRRDALPEGDSAEKVLRAASIFFNELIKFEAGAFAILQAKFRMGIRSLEQSGRHFAAIDVGPDFR